MEVVVAVRVLRSYVLEIGFADGIIQQVDVEPLLSKPIFEPLRDPDFFRAVHVDPVLGTIVWPNGADLSPEFLYAGGRHPASIAE